MLVAQNTVLCLGPRSEQKIPSKATASAEEVLRELAPHWSAQANAQKTLASEMVAAPAGFLNARHGVFRIGGHTDD